MYEYNWLPGTLISPEQLAKFAEFYSEHYGTWGKLGPKPGKPVRLSPEMLRDWIVPDSLVVWATALGELVGYAIAVQTKVPQRGTISWVTQLVVHEAHRRHNVGKTLLFTVWRFTDHFGWGLLSANPFAVRALEKATRRRCQPERIKKDSTALMSLGPRVAPYLKERREALIGRSDSRVHTKFFLDHTQLPGMLSSVVSDEKPWTMGPLHDGWEWFAFTFQDQEQIRLTSREIQEMLSASDTITKRAYARMAEKQPWAKNPEIEVQFIVENCGLMPGSTVVDFGCGQGRHALGLAARNIRTTGVDYVSSFIEVAAERARAQSLLNAQFISADCRDVDLGARFDAVLCLYDVIGSYVDETQNLEILRNIYRHLKPGGFALLSVMNMELTARIAKNWFSIESEPDKLLSLKPSGTMEKTGEVFNPEYYMIDRETNVVYRKEQFVTGQELPEEVVIRDRRYTQEQLRNLCADSGLEVSWLRFVHSGGWNEPLPREDNRAKEILVLCRKPDYEGQQHELFETRRNPA
jgi:2-polyprenyl-3-methyl-5-hydroxy-6-metoxy-1,4-benzoquinol methylase